MTRGTGRAFVWAACVLSAGRGAWAQAGAPARASAEEFAARAEELARAGDHGGAVVFARQALAMRETAALHLLLAREESALGHRAEAYAHARVCALPGPGALPVEQREECAAMTRHYEPLIGRVRLRFTTAVPENFEVRLNGELLPRALYGAANPVPAGPLVITMRMGEGDVTRAVTTVAEGSTRVIPVNVDLGEEITADVTQPAMQVDEGGEPQAPAPWQRPRAPGPTMVPWALVAVGGLGGIVSGTLAGFYTGQGPREIEFCRAHCTPQMQQDTEARWATIGTTALVLGVVSGALFTGGLVWGIVAMRTYRAPAVSVGPAGLVVSGRF